MRKLYELNDGKINTPSINEMDFHRLKWLDLTNPDVSEINEVSNIIKVSKKVLKMFVDRHELPRVSNIDNFTCVIYRSPRHCNKKKGLTTTSLTFLISERLLVTIHKDPISALTELSHDDGLADYMKEGIHSFVNRTIEHITLDYFIALDDVEEKINRIETEVFNHPSQKTVKTIFNIKRTLVYFHKSLSVNRDVLIRLKKAFPDYSNQYEFLHNEVVQLIDMITTYRDVLTSILDIYLSSVSNYMNIIMKKMAAYGTLVLVPTFITGLYGMNFKVMPELSWKYGYIFSWFLIIFSFIALYWYFKSRDWF